MHCLSTWMRMDYWRDKMLDTSKWKPFVLSDLFEIKKGKRLTKENQIPGDTVFIGATALNNGITAYIGQEALHEGNTISLTYNGSVGEAFYQREPFWASDDVNVLYAKNFILNEKLAMFFCTILRYEKQMWSYARKWNLEHMNQTIIKLPAITDEIPDFSWMESYIDTLDYDVNDIPDYFSNEGYNKACWYLDNINQNDFEENYAASHTKDNIKLTDRKWAYFELDKIVTSIQNGKSYNASDLTLAADDEYISYVTRTDANNGVSMYVQRLDYDGLEKANAITIGDTTATIFFQDHDFITGPHIIVIRADWLNVYTASFIISLLNMEKYRYPVFGRAFTKDLIKQTKLYLPITEENKPDYDFMEAYIKSLPFSNKI